MINLRYDRDFYLNFVNENYRGVETGGIAAIIEQTVSGEFLKLYCSIRNISGVKKRMELAALDFIYVAFVDTGKPNANLSFSIEAKITELSALFGSPLIGSDRQDRYIELTTPDEIQSLLDKLEGAEAYHFATALIGFHLALEMRKIKEQDFYKAASSLQHLVFNPKYRAGVLSTYKDFLTIKQRNLQAKYN